jgi:hypothetical protein
MKDFIYKLSPEGYLLKDNIIVYCPFAVADETKCGSWCALFDVFLGEHTMRNVATGELKKNPNYYIKLNCSHAVYTVRPEQE